MGKARVIWKDKYGNIVTKKVIKTRGVVQYSAKNAEGRLIRSKEAVPLIKRVVKNTGKARVWTSKAGRSKRRK